MLGSLIVDGFDMLAFPAGTAGGRDRSCCRRFRHFIFGCVFSWCHAGVCVSSCYQFLDELRMVLAMVVVVLSLTSRRYLMCCLLFLVFALFEFLGGTVRGRH